MKKILLAAVVAVAVVAGTIYALSGNKPIPLNVNDVASDPGGFTGTLAVTGVMAAASTNDKTIFGIMDKKELTCTTPGCNKFYLPVRWAGKLPAMGDEVEVTGSFTKEGGGYIFSATGVDVLRNHKLGG